MFYAHNTVAVIVEQPASLRTDADTEPRFLIVEEVSDGRVVFNQPAGHLEAGETLAAAALREALEETGWQVELTALVGLYQYVPESDGECYIRCCFAARAVAFDPHHRLDADIIRTHWFSRAELLARRQSLRSPAVLRVIDDYLGGQSAPLALVSTL